MLRCLVRIQSHMHNTVKTLQENCVCLTRGPASETVCRESSQPAVRCRAHHGEHVVQLLFVTSLVSHIITAFFCEPVPCLPSVTCCQRLQIPSVKTASAVTLTAHFSDVSSQHTGSDHGGRTPRSSRFSSAFSFFL